MTNVCYDQRLQAGPVKKGGISSRAPCAVPLQKKENNTLSYNSREVIHIQPKSIQPVMGGYHLLVAVSHTQLSYIVLADIPQPI